MSELYDDPSDEPVATTVRTLIVVSNFPDAETARKVAAAVVNERLAACANVMSPCHSIFRWEGELQEALEVPVWLKTTETAVNNLMARVNELHPHDVPELLVLTPRQVLADYSQWVQREVG
jgi:periplasmic divalent cation tolerance protein